MTPTPISQAISDLYGWMIRSKSAGIGWDWYRRGGGRLWTLDIRRD